MIVGWLNDLSAVSHHEPKSTCFFVCLFVCYCFGELQGLLRRLVLGFPDSEIGCVGTKVRPNY